MLELAADCALMEVVVAYEEALVVAVYYCFEAAA